MGKIHDKIKARAARINTVIVPVALDGAGRDTARQARALFAGLAAVRADRSIGSAMRHEMMSDLADKARCLGLKGRWNLLCNRTQCLRPDATWYNRGSHAFYCRACALDLNQVNRCDAEDLLGAGERLCVHVSNAEDAAKLHVMR